MKNTKTGEYYQKKIIEALTRLAAGYHFAGDIAGEQTVNTAIAILNSEAAIARLSLKSAFWSQQSLLKLAARVKFMELAKKAGPLPTSAMAASKTPKKKNKRIKP